MYGFPPVTIQCTPSTDGEFLAAVGRAFDGAQTLLDGDLAVLVGAMVRIRRDYPNAAVVAIALASTGGEASPLWLISRDGWAEIAAPTEAMPTRFDA